VTETFSLKEGLPNVWIGQMFEASDGRFWLVSTGLVEFFPHGDGRGRHFHTFTEHNGLSNLLLSSLSEDRAGNLWLASRNGGAMKLARGGFITYGRLDDIYSLHAIVEDGAGTLCFRGLVWIDAGAGPSLATRVGCFDGEHFEWFEPAAVSGDDWGWVLEGVTLRTRSNEFWVGGKQGVYRFAPADHFLDLKTARPRAIYLTSDGEDVPQVRRLFEDSGGNIWISTDSRILNGIARWDARTEQVSDLGRSPGLPSLKDDLARSFGEDASGIWLGFYGGLARYAGGSFTFFAARDGLPPGAILDMHRDRAGRLWLASDQAGLIRVDHTDTAHPTFVRYGTAEGLSSNDVEVITEDDSGFLYVGGGRGLDRFDPATSHVKHFTAADGLAPTVLKAAYRDGHGVLWFGTANGLARYVPVVDAPPVAPQPLISALRVSGISQPVSALGEHSLSLPNLAARQDQLEIDFIALAFGAGEVIRYQYTLDASGANWSAPSELRTVNYASLAPGRYTFLVRAVSSDGVSSAPPASITFTILRPIWLRWWFLTMAALAGSAALYGVYRRRVARLLEMAALRTRIATDLHDDIGANLTRIALLSDVAARSPDAAPLASIGRIARESVSAMGDIVWAINPKRESLTDLIRRMPQHAEEVFTLRDVDLQFTAAVPDQIVRLGIDVRRDLLLIFKEAVNNAARHSQCSRASIDLRVRDSRLVLTVEDNGVGFDASRAHEGQGLSSLRRRADRLHGALDIVSIAGTGTTVTLTVPTSLRS
jgi:signal transduction histidine kinase/streptogramin lyase